MNPYPKFIRPPVITTLVFGALTLWSMSGCATSEPGYAYSERYPQPTQVIVQDSYVYYPGYEVYYSSARREYVYLDGNVWVARRDPPRRWARDLRRAPYVQLDFRDSPQRHHQDVVRRYPRNWNRDRRNDRDDPDRRR